MVADALSQKSDVGELMTISLPKFSFLAEMKESDSHEEIQSIRSRLSKDPETVPGYTICGGWLCYNGRIMLPINSSLKVTILKEFRNTPSAGHEGYFRTYKRVMHNFYWKGVKRDVRPYVEECEVCQRSKYEIYHLPLPIPDRIWEDILLDFIDGLPKSGGKSTIMVVVNRLSKYGHFVPLAHPCTARLVAEEFAEHIFKLHAMPQSMVCDRDPIFISQFWTEFFYLQGTQLKRGTAYHPQTDGQTEVLDRC